MQRKFFAWMLRCRDQNWFLSNAGQLCVLRRIQD
jgi:hypothetical protein